MFTFDALRACLPKPPAFAFDWTGLEDLPPLRRLIDQMARTPQSPTWHGEGDVWTHTRLVCEALIGLPEYRALPDAERDALSLAALLHDVGKTRCKRLESGEWVSPRHGPVGAQLARTLLWVDFGLSGTPEAQRLREAACLLVRYHTRPLHHVEGSNPSVSALKLAANGELAPAFNLRALCLLAEADVRGRVAPDIPELLAAVELARDLGREEGCYLAPYAFPSPITERALFSGHSVWKDQTLYDETWGEVILMCALPGTGKDTWIREHCPGLPVVSLDDLRQELRVSPSDNQGRIVQAAKERSRALLRAHQPFVWNATSLTTRRAQQVDLFERYGTRVRIVYLETAMPENLRRNAGRPDPVPESVLYDMLNKLEPPERFESVRVDWLCI